MENDPLTLACSLTTMKLQERRATVLQKVGAAILEMQELEHGYRYRLPADDEWLDALLNIVRLERDCCSFLTFRLTVEPQHGPIWLEITGPQEMKVALASFFA